MGQSFSRGFGLMIATLLCAGLGAGCASEEAGPGDSSMDASRGDARMDAPSDDGGERDGMSAECTQDTDCDDGNDCTEDFCDFVSGSCMSLPVDEGTSCDADADGCTVGDVCARGRCVAGEPPACGDSLDCTVDRCISEGADAYRCESELSGGCLIDGACYADGAARPDNDCERCDETTPLVWSLSGVTMCDDGNSCTVGDMCQPDGRCLGRVDDPSEPNDTRSTAENLTPDWDPMRGTGGVGNRDMYPTGMFRRSLFPAADEDWFSFHVRDTTLGYLRPQVELLDLPAGQNYDLCAYYACDTEDIEITCSAGSPSTTADGLQGCCSNGDAGADERVALSPSCRTLSESGTVYFRVYRVSGDPVCSPYTIRWGDN